jgi:Domain of unknown function (DUF1887)
MKALLILVGGRPIPNILTVIHEKPEVIIPICSHESVKEEWPELKPAIERLSPTSCIEDATSIDAFAIDDIQKACELEFLKYPDADWIFNVTTATSLMTIGAYKAAENCRKLYDGASVRCWYLDTARSRTISLVGGGSNNTIFSITVDQYVAAYNYRLQDGSNLKKFRERYLKDDWLTFAKRLASNPQEASSLKQIINKSTGSPRTVKNIVKTAELYEFLHDLELLGLISKFQDDGTYVQFRLSEEQFKFLDGAWLELYVYQEAKKLKELKLFDDVEWSKEIIDNDPEREAKTPLQYKEMDVSLTSKAQLIVLECKTGKEGLESRTLDDIVNVADLIGRGFVMKVLITSWGLPTQMDPNQLSAHKDFLTKAKRRGVQVVTQDKLPLIGSILEEKAKTSKHAR